MKKIFKKSGIHFCSTAILLGISLLMNDYPRVDEELQFLMLVVICGAIISIGGYIYLKNRSG